MRGFLASSIGVTSAAALALPLVLSSGAAAAPDPAAAPEPASVVDPAGGSTQSLPLGPMPRDAQVPGPADQGLSPRNVHPFSLVGVIWNDPRVHLNGRVQVRTRSSATRKWTNWQEVTPNSDHGADPDSAESRSGRVRGSTAPLWVGASDGVEVRVHAEAPIGRAFGDQDRSPLPRGLRLELVDPGAMPRSVPKGARADRDGVLPALTRQQTIDEMAGAPDADPYIGPRPTIVTRKKWGADEKLREPGYVYTKTIDAAFVHHTDSGNNYSCSQAPSVIRSIYRYHVKSMGWRDIGYNFLVDKCGKIYEGRAGGVTKAVMGAHTLGFNTNTMGIAVIGSFQTSSPSSAALGGVEKLTAWKLGVFNANPRGKTYLTSAGGNLYAKGKKVHLYVISGHRDGVSTDCPGARLYSKLGTVRSTSARLQGR
ncbi:peptidoglycan recognition protein family protein [Streptomyces sp. NPDC002004]